MSGSFAYVCTRLHFHLQANCSGFDSLFSRKHTIILINGVIYDILFYMKWCKTVRG